MALLTMLFKTWSGVKNRCTEPLRALQVALAASRALSGDRFEISSATVACGLGPQWIAPGKSNRRLNAIRTVWAAPILPSTASTLNRPA